jgi:hypothetical protein
LLQVNAVINHDDQLQVVVAAERVGDDVLGLASAVIRPLSVGRWLRHQPSRRHGNVTARLEVLLRRKLK